MEVEYLDEIENGHLYKMNFLPTTCDLSLQTILKYLNIIEEVPDTVQPFQFAVTKDYNNTYLVKLFSQRLITQPEILNVTLLHLNGTMIVPLNNVESVESEEQVNEGDKTNQIIEIIQISLAVIIGGSIIGTIALGASSTVWSLVNFQQFIGYFIYINVHYPSQVEIFLSILQISFWDYLPNPLSIITEPLLGSFLDNNKIGLQKFQPPQKFVKYEKTSFFLEIGGSIILTNIILLVLLRVILSLKSLDRFQNKIFLKTVKVYLRWNVITRTFLENGLPLALAICLQLRILTFDGSYLLCCSILTIISIFYMIIMITFMIRVLYKRENILLKKGLIKRIYGTLHEGVILKKSTSKYFHIVILFRGLLLVCLISFFEDSPILQIIPLIFFNMGLIYYMIKEVDFEDKKLNVIIKVKEVLILFGEIGVMLLIPKTESDMYNEVVGWCIVGALGSGFFMELGYIIIIQIIGFKQIINHFVQLWKSFYSYMKSFCSSNVKVKVLEIRTARKKFKLSAPRLVRISSK